MNNRAKMYLQIDNGGYGILVFDGNGRWYYWCEAELPISLDSYDEDGRLDDEGNAEIIRKAITIGDMYSAEDMIEECTDYGGVSHYIQAYQGFSIEQIDAMENDRNFDHTKWIEIIES